MVSRAYDGTFFYDMRLYDEFKQRMEEMRYRVELLLAYYNVRLIDHNDERSLPASLINRMLSTDSEDYKWVNYLHPVHYLRTAENSQLLYDNRSEYCSWAKLVRDPTLADCEEQLYLHKQYKQYLLENPKLIDMFDTGNDALHFFTREEYETLCSTANIDNRFKKPPNRWIPNHLRIRDYYRMEYDGGEVWTVP